jgi:hypothetical protein
MLQSTVDERVCEPTVALPSWFSLARQALAHDRWQETRRGVLGEVALIVAVSDNDIILEPH